MTTDCIPQVTFEFYVKPKPVVARFDQGQASTDGGAMLLKAVDDRLRLTDQLARCVVDRRDPEKIRHSVRDLLRQRIMGLACGYDDANDAARLADDPLHKLAVGRDPVTDTALASQPTLSRFENAMSSRVLYLRGTEQYDRFRSVDTSTRTDNSNSGSKASSPKTNRLYVEASRASQYVNKPALCVIHASPRTLWRAHSSPVVQR